MQRLTVTRNLGFGKISQRPRSIWRAEEFQSQLDVEITQLQEHIRQLKGGSNSFVPGPTLNSPLQDLTRIFSWLACSPCLRHSPRAPEDMDIPQPTVHLNSTPRADSHLQSEVDMETAQLQEQMRQLKEKRNSFALITVLPVEILTVIFSWLSFMRHFRTRPSWIRVCHVCRYWRQAALHDPSLWSQIPTHLPADVAQVWLERSKHAPIDLYLSRQDNIYVNDLADHMKRVRTLKLDYSDKSSHDRAVQIFKSSMPMLEALDLRSSPIVTDIPTEWLKSHAHQFRNLYLHHCHFNWSVLLPRARKLTRLSIYNPTTLPNPNELVDFLRVVGGQLEVLRLDHVLSSRNSTSPNTLSPLGSRFSLPSLQSISIRGPYTECVITFISLIESYGKASIDLSLTSDPATENFGPETVCHCSRQNMLAVINFLASSQQPHQLSRVRLASTTDGVHLKDSSSLLNVSISGLHMDTSWVADLGHLAISNLQEIIIYKGYCDEAPISGSDLFLALSHLSKLSAIQLDGKTARSFLDHFALSGLATNPTLFPALESLTVNTDLTGFNATAFWA